MGKTLYPNGRLCKCGCGHAAEPNIVDGRNKGWLKYRKGHRPARPLCNPEIQAKARAKNRARLPAGTRRKHNSGDNNWYWVVKVEGESRWPLEHRYLMEQKVGRKLLRSEHVHHIDGNGLNNNLDNLMLLSAGEHSKLTNRETAKETCRCECPHCGAKLSHFKKIR